TESIDLSLLVDDILEDYSDDYQVFFYDSEDDANDGDPAEAIDTTNPFVVTVETPAEIWIRVQHDTDSLDFDVMSFTVTTSALPDIVDPTDYVLCNANGNGVQIFDLTTKNDEILNGETATVTYYESQEDAENEANAIATPDSYESGNTTVYVRVENADGCYAITSLNLVVSLFNVQEPTPYVSNCDLNGDGLEVFDLTTKNAEILNGDTATVTYHETETAALDNTDPIDAPQNYESDGTTIFVRITSTDECFVVFPLELVIPLSNVQEPTPYVSNCDINGDGLEIFNLTTKNEEILNGDTATITYHQTQTAAQNGVNPILNVQNYQSSGATIYVRVVYAGCAVVYPLNLVIPLSNVQEPTPYISNCDIDGDGLEIFDLTTKNDEILNGEVGTVTYHETALGAQTGTDIITNPENYQSGDA